MRTTCILDADDVLLDFRPKAVATLQYLGLEVLDGHVFWGDRANGDPFAEYVDANPLWVYNIPVAEGTMLLLEQLRALDLDVVVATRPYKRSRLWADERIQALHHRLGFAHDDIYLCANKSRIRGNMLVDDDPAHVRAWQLENPHGTGVLWDTPYTREEPLHHQSVRALGRESVVAVARSHVAYHGGF